MMVIIDAYAFRKFWIWILWSTKARDALKPIDIIGYRRARFPGALGVLADRVVLLFTWK